MNDEIFQSSWWNQALFSALWECEALILPTLSDDFSLGFG